MPASAALVYTPASIFPAPNPKTSPGLHPTRKPFLSQPWTSRKPTIPCGASAGSSSYYSPITEFNLYELLGVEASSDKAQIKDAYRALQKRCHPDIAGPAGHDMAIVLNEAYALLSDPHSRMIYDKELEKVADLQGYTGRPIYSTWFGSEGEDRAVFVDEVKCIGCLKCALLARKTFAVESAYGRARVVAQWADPENQIQEAIGACPVNCISMVERSNLAALEFLMSKQPRGRVRVGTGNTVGVRSSDVFNEMEKFQAKYADHKASFKGSESQPSSRVSAVQAIQMISNWLYWQSPSIDSSPLATTQNTPGRRHAGPSVRRLKAAVEARKQATTAPRPKESSRNNVQDYWVPSSYSPQEVTNMDSSSKADPSPRPKMNQPNNDKLLSPKQRSNNPLHWGLPLGAAVVAASVVRMQLGEPVGGLENHIGGSLALAIVNSPWSPVVLAGVTWYLVGIYVIELVEAFRRK